jgi:nucleoside-diphosphate-sugar epimerase
MTLLITGASGYLGSRLLNCINKKIFNVFSVSQNSNGAMQGYDLTCIDSVTRMIKKFNPECIIHCAGYVPSDMSGYRDISKNMSNELMTKNLLQSTSCPIIYVSSMTVYGSSHNSSIDESVECFPETAYAKYKLSGESLIKLDGREGFAVRIPGLFGLPRRSGLVHNLLMYAKYNTSFSSPESPIFWSGMHVADAADAILKLLPKINNNFLSVNIGYCGKLSINTLLEIINDLYKTDLRSEFEHPNFEIDLSLYRDLTSATVSTLREGIKKVGNEIG